MEVDTWGVDLGGRVTDSVKNFQPGEGGWRAKRAEQQRTGLEVQVAHAECEMPVRHLEGEETLVCGHLELSPGAALERFRTVALSVTKPLEVGLPWGLVAEEQGLEDP